MRFCLLGSSFALFGSGRSPLRIVSFWCFPVGFLHESGHVSILLRVCFCLVCVSHLDGMRDVSKALFQLWLLSWLLTSFLPLALMASSVFGATCGTRRQFHVSIKTARAAPFSLCLSASSFSHWSPLSSSGSGALLRPEWNGKRPQPHMINVFASPRRVDFSLPWSLSTVLRFAQFRR